MQRKTGQDVVASLASPIRRGDGKVIAAVGVSIPGFRAEDTIDQISSELVQNAQAITEDLSEIF